MIFLGLVGDILKALYIAYIDTGEDIDAEDAAAYAAEVLSCDHGLATLKKIAPLELALFASPIQRHSHLRISPTSERKALARQLNMMLCAWGLAM